MNKLIGGLALGLAMCMLESAQAQDDPFSIPAFEPTAEESRSLYLEVPPAQPQEPEPQPIIESLPVKKVQKTIPRISQRPAISGSLTSRPQNAHVRTTRTPAQEYIYQRAIFRAKQRTNRIEQRKWRGVSILRPSPSQTDAIWYNETRLPTWGADYLRTR